MSCIAPRKCIGFWILGVTLLSGVGWAAGAKAAPIYTIGNSNGVPSNTVNFSQSVLATGTGFTIADAELTLTFHPGQISPSNPATIPLLAGYVWVELQRSPTSGPSQTIRIFDFPSAYPSSTSLPPDSVLDHSDILVELNGAYVFSDAAAAEFHSAALALAGGPGITTAPAPPYPVLAPGTYQPSVAPLATLIGLPGDATYTVLAASLWSGTRGSVDWQLRLTAVPEPSTAALLSLALLGLATAARGRERRS